MDRMRDFFKRFLDISCSLCGMVLVFPVLLYSRYRIQKESIGNVIYDDERVGIRGKMFKCYKMRSMYSNGDEILADFYEHNPEQKLEYNKYHKLDNDPRITPFGAFIRKTSIDELPQLWNVLIGDMSLVGPRPYLLSELDDMGEAAETILQVKPGITGYWQVNGRSGVDFENRLLMDCWYVKNRSFWMDVKLLWQTVGVVLMRKGAK